MQYTKPFKELTKKDVNIAGGKGASLGEMLNADILVPDGFVLLSPSFDEFLSQAKLGEEIWSILGSIDRNVPQSIDAASEKIRTLILNAEIPEDMASEVMNRFNALGADFVAVRSSATAEDGADHAWAGQLESYLNITRETLIDKILHCWASLFTPRAIFYRLEKGLQGANISVAVVVQKMVNSKKSGIAFSVHPVSEDHNQVIIEAGFGLGEAIVSGAVTPDSYVVEKTPRRIVSSQVSHQIRALYGKENGGIEWIDLEEKGDTQVLDQKEILDLTMLVLDIETHYGFPCDIEWAYEAGKFFITQSRPITTLSGKAAQLSKSHFKKSDYMLSFWVQGVSVFVTDIHLDAYKELEVLYIIDQGMFKQYFTNAAYQRALVKGLEFYSDPIAFDTYREDLLAHCDICKEFFDSSIADKVELFRETVEVFFSHTRKLCGDYAKMNLEFTDKAFLNQDHSPIIKKNLEGVAVFKDRVRAIMNTVLFESDGYVAVVFGILGKQFDLLPAVFDDLTQEEILNLFEGKRPDESMVMNRQNAFVEHNDERRIYEGEEALEIVKEFREAVVSKELINGQTANKGKVIGKVKIIPVDYGNLKRVSMEIEKMEQGDILVAETTAPELIVACKKAGAIVTDMGGLMSHAAIVSREFGIPCIVGTGNASKILKDGDRVEVDADRGQIRILSQV